MPGNGKDVRFLSRLCRGPRHTVEARWRRLSEQYAVAEEGGGEGEGQVGVAKVHEAIAGALFGGLYNLPAHQRPGHEALRTTRTLTGMLPGAVAGSIALYRWR